MRFVAFRESGAEGLAVEAGGALRGLHGGEAGFPGTLCSLIRRGADLKAVGDGLAKAGRVLDPAGLTYLPPLGEPTKIICVGLNYADHTKESPYEQPNYPTLFPRFASSLIGHRSPIIRPLASDQLDYEGELVAVIGKAGRHIAAAAAHDHVVGYSIFNDASIRDYQFKSPQWTVGKNFDDTGAFGPCFVTADELPPGAKGLRLETRLNGTVMQSATTADMLFDVQTIITIVSEAISFQPGDVIVTGTPAGVGFGRKPPLFMKDGDVCEVSIEGIGVLSNPVKNEPARP